METESSLPHSQEPANCPYPEPAREEENIRRNVAAFVKRIYKIVALEAVLPRCVC